MSLAHTLELMRFEALRHHGLVTRAQAIAQGIRPQRLTDMVRRGAISRVARGVYAVGTSPAPADPALVVLPCRVVISFWSAVSWYGLDLAKPPDALHVTAGRSRGRSRDSIRGVRLHRASLAGHEVQLVRGLPVTSPARTVIDVARVARLEDGVAVADAFIRCGALGLDDLHAAAAGVRGPGRARLMLVLSLVDPACGSVLESNTRVLLWRHGVVKPRSQWEHRDARSGWVGYLDFAWPELRVALECDGYEFHTDRATFQKDRRRWSALTRADWRLGVVTWFDVMGDPEYVVALVRDLLDAALQSTTGTTVTGEAVA
jgi:hypothetical protein